MDGITVKDLKKEVEIYLNVIGDVSKNLTNDEEKIDQGLVDKIRSGLDETMRAIFALYGYQRYLESDDESD